jgi:hypothetical protein
MIRTLLLAGLTLAAAYVFLTWLPTVAPDSKLPEK